MKVVVEGHRYEVSNFENKESVQTIQFIHKEKKSEDSDVLNTISDGTTNEEVLAMMIDRMKFLNAKVPSRESSIAITKLEEALMWLNKRTQDRVKRGVEGTRNK